MSGSETMKTISAPKPAKLQPTEREDHPVRWPSAATSGGAVYVSYPESKSGAAGPETGAEG
jgi:hypothetical protein